MNNKRNMKRRDFLKLGATGGSLVALASIPIQLVAQDMVPESDPLAQAMGYVEDANDTDTTKFPKRAGEAGAKQFCDNCALYAGEEGSASAPCSIFQNRHVTGKGWCNAWVAKS